MTSCPHAPYVLGYTHPTMGGTEGCKSVSWSQSHKAAPSSDCRLQLAYMKSESLVTAGQQHGGEYVPGPCTHRPSSDGSRLHPKPLAQPVFRREVSKVGSATGAKS